MRHLTEDEIVAAADGALDNDRQAHLAACDACGREVAQFAALLREVQAVPVPDPSPLFWDRFSERVSVAIAAAPSQPRRTRWFQWPVLVPLGALAVIVMALASAVPPTASEFTAGDIAEASSAIALPFEVSDDEEAHWQLMAALVSEVTAEEAEQEGFAAAPGAAEDVVLELSSAEQAELLRLLRQELGQSGG
jgi:anti-sigma factor RsiW